MKAMHTVEQWLKQQIKVKPQPKLIIVMVGKKKQLLSNQWYECGQYPDY